MDREQPLASAANTRRLATIVAIDAAGYSRQSEIDEAVAIREITALAERIRASAASQGGRVFNTAGDGFMLEFAAPSSALAAAEEIQALDRVPLRIGVHLGEVSETPSQDLLGRGVNVAARLMALAKPGEILISSDVRRTLPPEAAGRLAPRGAVQLDKMQERIDIFVVGSPWGGGARRKFSPRLLALIGAGAALLALAIFGFSLLQPHTERVAVLAFETPGADSLESLATGISDRIVAVMSANELQAVPRARAARFRSGERSADIAFIVDGAVRQSGTRISVSAQIVDARENVALWSNEYERPLAEAEYLPEQVAANLGHVLRCALISRRPNSGPIDVQTLTLFLRACDRSGRLDEYYADFHQTARQITERAPNFSRGWSMRAISAAQWSHMSPPTEAAAYAAEAREAAQRARRLDRGNGESYLGESYILPVYAWSEREALVDQALATEPDLAEAHASRSRLYAETGRVREAIASLRRAAAIEPLSQAYWIGLTPLLSAAGHQAETDVLRARYYRVWPLSPSAWQNRFSNSAYIGDPREALAILDETSAPILMEADVRERWRPFLRARQTGDNAALRRAALDMLPLLEARRTSRLGVATALLTAGELDAAYRVLDEYLSLPGASTYPIFFAPYAPLHREPRFMRLVRGTGLIEYWQATGHWPDFCRAPNFPYDCAAEGARALNAPG